MLQDRDYFLGFSVFSGVGPKRFADLITAFGTAKNAWHGDDSTLITVLGKAYGNAFLSFRKQFSIAEYLTALKKKNVSFLTLADTLYPHSLREVPLSPFVLYLRGNDTIFQESERYIGIVGTRKITGYGTQVTELITEELVFGGCVIVSGLALGVDAVAHKTTLAAGGKTIAVLGSGVDICHPSSNRVIYDAIISQGGTVVSEYPLGEPPSKGSFPSRNRIIAGLSEGIVVTEGASDSGALITARDALSFNRRVYAVPGPITSMLSKGPNSLLAEGAKLVTSGKDILDDLSIKSTKDTKNIKGMKGETEEEQRIIDLLQNESLLFDEIVKKTGFDSTKTGILLSVMELKGVIKNIEGGMYSL
jgi:DNA processing protein